MDASGDFVTVALAWIGAVTSNYEVSYEGDLKLLVDKAGDECLPQDIEIWAQEAVESKNRLYKNQD
ncbi:hypothetical protein [Mucilaginibacter sp.]|uniref:hypothetical protein n=1 Tax=Mucilaginibacter sp. TaxID=1882438 RepID=UPI00374D3E99